MKILTRLIILAVMTCIFASCSAAAELNPVKDDSSYLSMTVTDKNMENHYYTYTLDSNASENKAIENAQTKDTAQYPLGVVDKGRQVLYYAKRDSTRADQLVRKDLATGKEEQLTTELFAINNMIPIGNEILLVAVAKNKNVVQIASYNLDSKQLRFWNAAQDNDTSVRDVYLNARSNKLYIVWYSFEEELKHTKEAEQKQTGDVKPAKHWVIEYNLSNASSRQVYSTSDVILNFSVTDDSKTALIRSAPTNFSPRVLDLYQFDTQSKERLDSAVLKDTADTRISPNGQGIYFTAMPEEQRTSTASANVEGPPNQLYYYGLKTQTLKPLFSKQNNYINNFQLLAPSSDSLNNSLLVFTKSAVQSEQKNMKQEEKSRIQSVEIYKYSQNSIKPQLEKKLTLLPDTDAWAQMLSKQSRKSSIQPGSIQMLKKIVIHTGTLTQPSISQSTYIVVKFISNHQEKYAIKSIHNNESLQWNGLNQKELKKFLSSVGTKEWSYINNPEDLLGLS